MVSRGAYYSEHIFMGFIMNIYVIFVLFYSLIFERGLTIIKGVSLDKNIFLE